MGPKRSNLDRHVGLTHSAPPTPDTPVSQSSCLPSTSRDSQSGDGDTTDKTEIIPWEDRPVHPEVMNLPDSFWDPWDELQPTAPQDDRDVEQDREIEVLSLAMDNNFSGICVDLAYKHGREIHVQGVHICQQGQTVQHAKQSLMKEAGVFGKHKDYKLVIYNPDKLDFVKMEDEKPISHYWDDLTNCSKLWIRKKKDTSILVHVSLPDGRNDSFPIQFGDTVEQRKKWLLQQEGFHGQHLNYTLEIELPGEVYIEMDDEQSIENYKAKLQEAVRILFVRTGILLEVSYPDGRSESLNIDLPLDECVEVIKLKRCLLKRAHIPANHEDYALVIDLLGKDSVTMDDSDDIKRYMNDLSTAVKISLRKGIWVNVSQLVETNPLHTRLKFRERKLFIWQRGKHVQHIKKWLFDLGDKNFVYWLWMDLDLVLFIELGNGDLVEMKDEQLIDHHWNDLTKSPKLQTGLQVKVMAPGDTGEKFTILLGKCVQDTREWLLKQRRFQGQHQKYALRFGFLEGDSIWTFDVKDIKDYNYLDIDYVISYGKGMSLIVSLFKHEASWTIH